MSRKPRKAGPVQRTRQSIRVNGARWTAYYLLNAVLRRVAYRINQRMRNLEMKRALTGTNTVQNNYTTWQGWDWSNKGEEWSESPEWKQGLIDYVMLKYMEPQSTALEIGPGAGRWTETLHRVAGHLIVVDLSDKCIELCKQRFDGAENIEFHVNDGRSLECAATESVDFVWSYDVFVHIAPPEIDLYLAEIYRVLKQGGRGVIHHTNDRKEASVGDIGWRSSMTARRFADLLEKHNLKLITQLDSWGPNNQFDVRYYGDVISVFEK